MKKLLLLENVLLCSCAVPGPNGETVYSLDFGSDSCSEAKQFVRGGNVTVSYAKDIKAEGMISSTELIEISQEVFLLNGQASQACRFFSKGQISFNQYQAEMKEVRSSLLALTRSIPSTE